MLGSHTAADTVGHTEELAKRTAAEQALNRLSSICYTIQKKQLGLSAVNSVTRHEVSIP